MPILLTGVLIVLAAAVVSTAGFLLVSKWVPEKWLIADSDAAGALYATIGVVYAIFIAIAAIAVWEPHDNASQATAREAGDLSEAYWSARGLAPADGAAIRGLIGAYTETVIDREWPRLRADHQPSAQAEDLFAQLRTRVEAVAPVGDTQTQFYQDVLLHVDDAADARRARLTAAGSGMPPLVWPTLILSSAVSVGLPVPVRPGAHVPQRIDDGHRRRHDRPRAVRHLPGRIPVQPRLVGESGARSWRCSGRWAVRRRSVQRARQP